VLIAFVAAITATLDLFPAETLPALRPAIRVTLHNSSRSSSAVRALGTLHIKEADGRESVAKGRLIDERDVNWSGSPRKTVQLRGHETHDYWFGELVAVPQSYSPAGDESLAAALPIDPGERTVWFDAGGLVTNRVTYTVVQPRGVDGDIFEKMLRQYRRPKLDSELAAEIVHQWPHSGYYLTALIGGGAGREEFIDRIDAALAAGVPQPWRDILLSRKGDFLTQAALTAYRNQSRLERSLSIARDARAALQELVSTGIVSPLRNSAQYNLRMMSEQSIITEFYTHYAHNDEGVTERVAPVVTCVEPLSGGGFIAHFGFSSPNAGSKYVPIGFQNRVEPGPDDAGQPSYFWRTWSDTFGVVSEGQPVTWHLDGNTAVASLDPSIPRCNRGTRDYSYAVQPLVDCVRRDKDGLFVSFGYETPSTIPRAFPIGPENRIDASANGTQPTIFLAGTHRHVIEITADQPKITWTIGAVSAIATEDFPVVCKSP